MRKAPSTLTHIFPQLHISPTKNCPKDDFSPNPLHQEELMWWDRRGQMQGRPKAGGYQLLLVTKCLSGKQKGHGKQPIQIQPSFQSDTTRHFAMEGMVAFFWRNSSRICSLKCSFGEMFVWEEMGGVLKLLLLNVTQQNMFRIQTRTKYFTKRKINLFS